MLWVLADRGTPNVGRFDGGVTAQNRVVTLGVLGG